MSPRVVTTKAGLRAELAAARSAGHTVGLVPTMGYLHEGHASLARRARAENDLVVLTIFVNPTQFAPGEDLERYPRDLPRDLSVAEGAGVDLVFHPEADEMYLPGHATWVDVEGLTDQLCGASRPGHFRGVATVVTKLLALCRPDRAYFGQKDAQQAFVIDRVAADLDLGAEIVVCPIVREADGLAMSSRNVYLTPEERAQAPALFAALRLAGERVAGGERDATAVVAAVRSALEAAPLTRVDYVELVATATLAPVARLEGRVLLALAVWFGRTRLIDNEVLEVG
jgi:pantoate--beta-alanine ligase